MGAAAYQGIAGRGVTGLFYGDSGQLIAQVIGGAAAMAWGLGLAYAFFKVLDRAMGMRCSREDELEGLDIPEMGALAYPDFVPPSAPGAQPEGDSGGAGEGRASGCRMPLPDATALPSRS